MQTITRSIQADKVFQTTKHRVYDDTDSVDLEDENLWFLRILVGKNGQKMEKTFEGEETLSEEQTAVEKERKRIILKIGSISYNLRKDETLLNEAEIYNLGIIK
jgi:hypothetical protein